MSATIREYNSDEEFDDDTDLPLPSAPTPSAVSAPRASPAASSSSSSGGPAPGSNPMMDTIQQMMASMGQPDNDPRQRADNGITTVEDAAPFKLWHPIYPIYLDAKRAFGPKGGRRISREQAHWWPTSNGIVDALKQLGMPVFHEMQKTHPKDWANPGRVKTELKREDGDWINDKITNRKQLYTQVSLVMHRLSRSSAPRPSNLAPRTTPVSPPTTTKTTPPTKRQNRPHAHGTLLPRAPKPHPSLEQRYTEFSPALPGGHYLEILKGEAEREKKAKEEARKARLEAGGKEDEPLKVEGGEEAGKKSKKDKKDKVKMVRVGKR